MRAVMGTVLVLAACASDDEGEEPGPCAAPVGSYTVNYEERSGTCGEISEQVVVFESGGGEGGESDCSENTTTVSPDGCRIEGTQVCPSDFGGTVTSTVSLSLNRDGTRLQGVVAFTFDLDDGRCQSTYDVTYRKL